MSMSIRPIAAANVAGVQSTSQNAVNNVAFKAENGSSDKVELSKKPLTTEAKQEILQKARQKAAGYSVFGGPFSVLYYGLRSDEKIAKKYNLDINADKKFIKQLKNEQFKWTLPSVIPFAGLVGAVVSYIYNRNVDPSDLKIKG